MLLNDVTTNTTSDVYITPVLLDNNNNPIQWAIAKTTLQATCVWSDLENAQPYGTISLAPEDKIKFTPENSGTFAITCTINYIDALTQQPLQSVGILKITVVKTDTGCKVCEINVSTKVDNRLVKEADGSLYVPEVTVDLLAWFYLAKG